MYSLPVNVLWVSKCKYTHEILEKHTHDCYHLFYVKKGKGRMSINYEEYDIKENTIYFFCPGIIHGYTPDETEPTYTIEVKFLLLDKNLKKDIDTFKTVIEVALDSLCTILEELVLEALYKPLMYEEIINAGFAKFLFELIRNNGRASTDNLYTNERNFERTHYNRVILKNVVEYIHSNYSGCITVQELSNVGKMSSARLYKLFNSLFMVSPMQYVNSLRIARAKELIMYSDFNITQISEMVGFQSVHYFSRYFKKRENMTPVEYKNRVHENVVVLLGEKAKVESYNCNIV